MDSHLRQANKGKDDFMSAGKLAALGAACLLLLSGVALAEQPASLDVNGYTAIDVNQNGLLDTGDTLYFGSYPQSLVEDEALADALTAGAEAPSVENGWTSYGYYDAGAQEDYALYLDV